MRIEALLFAASATYNMIDEVRRFGSVEILGCFMRIPDLGISRSEYPIRGYPDSSTRIEDIRYSDSNARSRTTKTVPNMVF